MTTDLGIIHAGTNSMAANVSINRAVQETFELIETVKTVTQCTSIFVSLILPRWNDEFIHARCVELNEVFKKMFRVIDLTEELLPEHLYGKDKLHLNFEGVHCLHRYSLKQ